MPMQPVANIRAVIGQSQAATWHPTFMPYPGTWTVDMIGSGLAEVMWNGAWQAYEPGVNSDGEAAGVNRLWGPEAGIALYNRGAAQRQQVQHPIYFVKHAPGSTGQAPNPSGADWSAYSDGEAFGIFCDRLQAAMDALASVRYPLLDEIYWIGNDSDTFTAADATAVLDELDVMARVIRGAFNAPDCKFVVAQLNSTFGGPGNTRVRCSHTEFGSRRRNAVMRNVNDLTVTADGHYDPLSVVTLGRRLAAAAAAIVD